MWVRDKAEVNPITSVLKEKIDIVQTKINILKSSNYRLYMIRGYQLTTHLNLGKQSSPNLWTELAIYINTHSCIYTYIHLNPSIIQENCMKNYKIF